MTRPTAIQTPSRRETTPPISVALLTNVGFDFHPFDGVRLAFEQDLHALHAREARAGEHHRTQRALAAVPIAKAPVQTPWIG